MVKKIYFYCLTLDSMVLQVTGTPCTDEGHKYNFVSDLDHLGFKFGGATNENGTWQYPRYRYCTIGPSVQLQPYQEGVKGLDRSYRVKL
jgi:hypothetical protein